MKSIDGNDSARPLANESAVYRMQDSMEEKKSLSPVFGPGSDGQPASFSNIVKVHVCSNSPKEEPCDSMQKCERNKRMRKRMARRPSDMLQAATFKQMMYSGEKVKVTDLHIESTSLQDPDLATVDCVWSILLFICCVYNYFTFFFFLGIQLSPMGIWRIAEVVTELILFIDAMAMTILNIKRPQLLKHMPLVSLLESNEWQMAWSRLALRLISSYPQHTINLLCRVAETALESLPLALLRGLKLLRYPETIGYIDRQLRQVKGANAVYMQGAKSIFTIFFIFHIMCSVWLLVNRLERESDWKYEFGFDKANVFEYYSIALLFAVSNRGGTAPGDSYPVSPEEKLTFCALVFCASTTVAALFGSLASGIYISNARAIQNNRKLDQIKIYSSTRNLPEELKLKLKCYFALMHLEYSKYEEQYALLQELPSCLRGELVLHINVDFIQKVKLFQLSESSFIIAMVNQLKPIICLFGDYIVRRGEMADSMYFLKKGLIRVLCADDENVTLAYLGEGCYFGEIGVLLTGKRSASVVAHTNCVLYDIKKEPLLRILDAFGYHRVFLESVGRQRLQTTYLKDLQQDENISAGANMTNASVMFERTNTLSVSAREMQQQQQRFFIEARSK